MKKIKSYSFIALLMLSVLFVKPSCVYAATVTIDGDLSEWSAVPEHASNNSTIDGFKLAFDDDQNLYFCAYGPTQNVWNNDYQWLQFVVNNESRQFGDGYSWSQITGAQLSMSNSSTDSTPGRFSIEMMLPASYFAGNPFTVQFAGNTVSSDDIIQLDNSEQPQEPVQPEEPVQPDVPVNPAEPEAPAENVEYSGIVIDGSFADWESVTKKYNFNNNLTEAAFVWDGDFVYVYVKENPDNYEGNIHGATPYSNGNFCIETENGYKNSVYILGPSAGVPSASINGESLEMSYNNHCYEVKVPVSMLRGYTEQTSILNFGTMGGGNDIPNYIIQGVNQWNPAPGTVPDPEGTDTGDNSPIYNKPIYITYDYDFSDWKNYPHDVIQYSTGGSHGADAEGSLYTDGDHLLGHIMYYGAYYNDIFGYFELAVNGDKNHVLQLSAKVIDSNGQPVGNYNMYGLGEGTYEFHVFGPETVDGGAWTTDYGKIFLKVDATGKIEAEFCLDQSKIAHFYKVEQTDLKTNEMRFIRIGDHWIACAGTSTGPILGIAICLAVVAISRILLKKRSTGKLRSAIA